MPHLKNYRSPSTSEEENEEDQSPPEVPGMPNVINGFGHIINYDDDDDGSGDENDGGDEDEGSSSSSGEFEVAVEEVEFLAQADGNGHVAGYQNDEEEELLNQEQQQEELEQSSDDDIGLAQLEVFIEDLANHVQVLELHLGQLIMQVLPEEQNQDQVHLVPNNNNNNDLSIQQSNQQVLQNENEESLLHENEQEDLLNENEDILPERNNQQTPDNQVLEEPPQQNNSLLGNQRNPTQPLHSNQQDSENRLQETSGNSELAISSAENNELIREEQDYETPQQENCQHVPNQLQSSPGASHILGQEIQQNNQQNVDCQENSQPNNSQNQDQAISGNQIMVPQQPQGPQNLQSQPDQQYSLYNGVIDLHQFAGVSGTHEPDDQDDGHQQLLQELVNLENLVDEQQGGQVVHYDESILGANDGNQNIPLAQLLRNQLQLHDQIP